MRKREEVKKMFAQADQYILQNPKILSKSTDDIFNVLDDGTEEMRHMRWGVMTRAKLAKLEKFDAVSILHFLSTVTERNLLCEYIGYILQEEKAVDLLKLVVVSEMNKIDVDLLPFVYSNVEYENDIEIEDISTIIIGLGRNKESNLYQSALMKMGQLIVRSRKADAMLSKYMSAPTDELKKLVHYVGVEVCKNQSNIVENIIDRLIKQGNRLCDISAIDIWKYCALYNLDCTDIFVEDMISFFSSAKEYRLNIIPGFVDYLEEREEGKYRALICANLQEISDIDEKICLMRAVEYKEKLCIECKQVVDKLLEVSFEKNEIILGSLDFRFEELAEQDMERALVCLKNIYRINEYTLDDDFFGKLPMVCEKFLENQEVVCKNWVADMLHGDLYAFMFAIKLFGKGVKITGFIEYIITHKLVEPELILLVKGILLFSIEAKKLCELIYASLPYVEVTQDFMDMCREMIYKNYPGTFIAISKQYVESENMEQQKFAKYFIEYGEEQYIKINEGYENEELQPSEERRKIFLREQREQNERINEDARKQSILAQFVSNQKMKYGKRHAYIQVVTKGRLVYQIGNYVTHTIEYELPKELVSNPIEYLNLRRLYLESRCNYASDN